MSNSSSEFMQQMYGEDELAKDMGIFDTKKSVSVGSMSSHGKRPMMRASSPVGERRSSLNEDDLPDNLEVIRSNSNGRSSADKILYHTQESPVLPKSDGNEEKGLGSKRRFEEIESGSPIESLKK
jgi:hypothetical protein